MECWFAQELSGGAVHGVLERILVSCGVGFDAMCSYDVFLMLCRPLEVIWYDLDDILTRFGNDLEMMLVGCGGDFDVGGSWFLMCSGDDVDVIDDIFMWCRGELDVKWRWFWCVLDFSRWFGGYAWALGELAVTCLLTCSRARVLVCLLRECDMTIVFRSCYENMDRIRSRQVSALAKRKSWIWTSTTVIISFTG